MKKAIIVIVLIICYIQKYEYVDLSKFASERIKVEVKGEVNKPGVYEIPYQSNVKDAIEAASGFRESANQEAINQANIVKQNDVIHVPKINNEKKQISINTATMEQLTTLNGVGPSTAQKIIDFRNEHGCFQTIEDIMKVKGIKQKLFDKMKDQITL